MKAIQTVEPTKEDVAFDVRDIVVDKQQREMLLLNFEESHYRKQDKDIFEQK